MPFGNLYETHPGFARMFRPGRLTLGMMLPMAPLENGRPDMRGQLELAAEVDRYGCWRRPETEPVLYVVPK